MSMTSTSVGWFRWRICAMLLAATTINYVDRQVLGVLAPSLQESFGWSELQYSYIVMAFQAAYAIGLLCAGAVIDRLGTRVGYALAIAVWSAAAMSTSLATGVVGFAAARFALGLGRVGQLSLRHQGGGPNGSRSANVRWPPASSIQAPTSAPSSRRRWCR